MIRHLSLVFSWIPLLFLVSAGCSGDSGELTCGNGVRDPGETCDGDCPSECNDGDACTTDSMTGSVENCDVVCNFQPVTGCTDSDDCCPASCNSTSDSDCPVECGNGIVESGETCDGDCPTECDDGDSCTIDVLVGDADNCNAACSYSPVTECEDGDGCCPAECNYSNDDDCYICQASDEPEDLRVDLPADEGAHHEDLEWWYWTGHLRAEDGRWFGFELVFFLANSEGMWGQIAHHAITDVDAESFHHVTATAIGRPEAVQDGFRFDLSPLTAEGGQGRDALHGEVDNYTLDLVLRALKSPVYQHVNGYTDYPFGGNTYYYSRERMALQGTLKIDDQGVAVTGTAWFDHQWGELHNATSIGWDWFALQLDDDREIMLFIIRDGESNILAGGSYTDAVCTTIELNPDEVDVVALDEWTSPHTGRTYPMGWELHVKDMNFTITPVIEDQELHGMYTPEYWEGAATVTGDASGRAYIELTGY